MMFGKLNSEYAIKMSVFMNGPCIMGLPVYDSSRDDFWNGSSLEGGHAIACVGYDEEGFILMNSWGSGFGFGGRCVLPYGEINKILECWAIVLK
jgi:C1A family cysteine protease